MNFLTERGPIFILVLIRFSGLVAAAPFFSSSMINTKVKMFFVIAFAVMLTSVLSPAKVNAPVNQWIGIVVTEFGVGLVLGLGARIAFSAASMAGELMGLQMGIGQAALYDPNSEQQVSPLEQFYSMLFLTVFLAMDGQHHILRALRESYVLVPIERAGIFNAPVDLLIIETGRMMTCGCRMAAPVIAPLFLLSLSVALVSRAYPHMNMHATSSALSILGGMVLLAASMPGVPLMVEGVIREMDSFAIKTLQLLGAITFGGFARG